MSAPKTHQAAIARLMRETTGHTRWRTVPQYAAIHHVVGAALASYHARRPVRGAGLGDWIQKAKGAVVEAVQRAKNFVTGARDGLSPPAQKMLDKYGYWTVASLTIRRDPIQSALNTAFNLVTLGKWNEARAKYSFDKLFHLGLVAGLTSPSGQHAELLLEKNAVINIGLVKAQLENTELMRCATPSPPVTLAEFVDKTKRAMGDKFASYSAFTNNCQDFVRALLSSNGVLSDGADAFLKQHLDDVIKEQPGYTGAVADTLTDLGARADRLVNGGAKKRKARPRKARGGGLGFSKALLDQGIDTEEKYQNWMKGITARETERIASERAAEEEALKHPRTDGVRPWGLLKATGAVAKHIPGLGTFGRVIEKGADVGADWAGGAVRKAPRK